MRRETRLGRTVTAGRPSCASRSRCSLLLPQPEQLRSQAPRRQVSQWHCRCRRRRLQAWAAAHQQACRLLTFRMTPSLQVQDARRSKLECWTCTTSCVHSTSEWGGAGCTHARMCSKQARPSAVCSNAVLLRASAPQAAHRCCPSAIPCSVPPLKWDAALAAKAQAHANKCSWGHSNGRTLYPNGESIVRRMRGVCGLPEAWRACFCFTLAAATVPASRCPLAAAGRAAPDHLSSLHMRPPPCLASAGDPLPPARLPLPCFMPFPSAHPPASAVLQP